MSSSSFLHARVRARSLISVSIVFAIAASICTNEQRVGAQYRRPALDSFPATIDVTGPAELSLDTFQNSKRSVFSNETSMDSTTRTRVDRLYGQLPLSFEENQGQADPIVSFIVRSAGYNLLPSAGGPTMAVATQEKRSGLAGLGSREMDRGRRTAVSLIQVSFINANKEARVQRLDKLSGKSNHMIGARKDWRLGVSSFAQVQYSDIYPGVDVVYHGKERSLEI